MKPILASSISVTPEPKSGAGGQASDRATLAAIAHQAMIERGLEPDFRRAKGTRRHGWTG